jgi:ADP-ribose pyrophosphatase
MRKKKETILGRGKYARLVCRNTWEFVDRIRVSGIVVIVAVTHDGKLVLAEQYREPVRHNVIELPAGLVGDKGLHERLTTAAKRELLEETGYSARKMEFLCQGPPSVGLSTEMVTFYRAVGIRKVGEGGGDASENIIIHEAPLINIEAWFKQKEKRGILVDPKVYAGVYFAKKFLRRV